MTETLPRPRTRLYLITPPRIDDVQDFAATLETCLDAGDVACLQVRIKDGDTIDMEATRAVSLAIKDICQSRGAALIINDSPELAMELGADGVHLGADDMDVKAARELMGPEPVIGATCKDSRHLGMTAGEAGADYVAFGAFYPTETKASTTPASLETLEVWQEMMELPCVAIGGITLENARPVIEAGADFIAVSSGVWAHEDGAPLAVARFNALLDELAEA